MIELGTFEIRKITMNPWAKNVKRLVYGYGGKFYIKCTRGSQVYAPVLIEGKKMAEVEKVGSCWFFK